jgi:TniQ
VRTRAHDLDVHPSYELIAEVSRRTGVNYNRIVQMTLRGHVESWVGRKAMSQEPEDAFGFCPSCWAADTEPYIRRAWRLPWTACALHRIALCRQCPACHWISSWSHLAAVGGLAVCGGCGADLRQAPPPRWAEWQTKQMEEHLAWQAEQFRRGDQQWVLSAGVGKAV